MGKRDRQGHDYIVMAVFEVSPAEAKRAHRTGRAVMLDHENRTSLMVGCYACEKPYHEARRGRCVPAVGTPPRPRSPREKAR